MRIFLGLTEVSGFYSNLRKGFQDLGIEADLVSLTPHRFGYEETAQPRIVKMAQWCVAKRSQVSHQSLIQKLTWLCLTTLSRLLLFGYAVIRYDVFIFCCGTSFFRFRELPVLKGLGKRIIYSFHGTDGRPGFMDGFAENNSLPQQFRASSGYIGYVDEGESGEERASKIKGYADVTCLRKQNVAQIDRYADVVIDSPSHGQFHTRPFVQRTIIGMPYKLETGAKCVPLSRRDKDEVTILHSPSSPEGKGTPGIRAAIKALQEKGYQLHYIEITGRPNREVLEMLPSCDFAIDQLYSDMPMVGFATEAAVFGKPAIVGGYYAAEILHDLPADQIPPSLFCLPEEIQGAIEKLITDVDFRRNLGEQARRFVERNWSADAVAGKFMTLIRGDIPKDWLFDPANCSYVLGMGLSKERLSRIVKGVYDEYGSSAFQLDDKPVLLSKLMTISKIARAEA